jgi:hypothetical protein
MSYLQDRRRLYCGRSAGVCGKRTGLNWEVAEWLGCEQETRKSDVPFFAQWSETTMLVARQIDSSGWRWKHLHCPNGHHIKLPSYWRNHPSE